MVHCMKTTDTGGEAMMVSAGLEYTRLVQASPDVSVSRMAI